MLQIYLQRHLMLADFNIRLQVLECLTSEVLIEGRLIVLYTKDVCNEMEKLHNNKQKWVKEAQTRFEAASKQSNDPPLSRVNTLGSGEDNMKLKELMELCTKLSERVLDLR
ncbi:hypothetical protein Tco_0270643 [Tanacetum coccineum]